MKKPILIILLGGCLQIQAQSKKEQIQILTTQMDSLLNVIKAERELNLAEKTTLENTIKKHIKTIEILNTKINDLNATINRGNIKMDSVKNELNSQIKNLTDNISMLKNNISILKDSIVYYSTQSNKPIATKTDATKTDSKIKSQYVRAKFTGVEVGDFVHYLFTGEDNTEYDFWWNDVINNFSTDEQDANPKLVGKYFDIYYHVDKINISENPDAKDYIDGNIVDKISLVK